MHPPTLRRPGGFFFATYLAIPVKPIAGGQVGGASAKLMHRRSCAARLSMAAAHVIGLRKIPRVASALSLVGRRERTTSGITRAPGGAIRDAPFRGRPVQGGSMKKHGKRGGRGVVARIGPGKEGGDRPVDGGAPGSTDNPVILSITPHGVS